MWSPCPGELAVSFWPVCVAPTTKGSWSVSKLPKYCDDMIINRRRLLLLFLGSPINNFWHFSLLFLVNDSSHVDSTDGVSLTI